ncbi:MAG: hypothetical protein WCI30_01140 [Clostridia bacterium]
MEEQVEVLTEIKKRLVNGKLMCADAHSLEREQAITLAEIGRLCEENKIKISACELGCF